MERHWNERIRLMSLAACMLTLVSANAQHVTVDGLKYYLYPDTHEAVIDNENTWEGELELPSEISYNGEAFTVNGMAFSAFADCKKLTKVIIPKSIDHVVNHVLTDDPHVTGAVSNEFMNPFVGCTALESIEVDEGNPSWKSIGGVLFSKDGTCLYCYPAGIRAESYVVPDGVILVGGGTFSFNEHIVSVELPATVNRIYGGVFANCKRLEKVNLPENLTILGARMFSGCSSLKSIEIPAGMTSIAEQVFVGCSSLRIIDLPESVRFIGSLTFSDCTLDALVIRGQLDSQSVGMNLFANLSESTNVYTLASQIDSFKKLFAGTVLPLEDYKGTQNTVNIGTIIRNDVEAVLHNLQGHRLTTPPRRGVYIRDGRKVVMK